MFLRRFILEYAIDGVGLELAFLFDNLKGSRIFMT
jgi:hypothetical protein